MRPKEHSQLLSRRRSLHTAHCTLLVLPQAPFASLPALLRRYSTRNYHPQSAQAADPSKRTRALHRIALRKLLVERLQGLLTRPLFLHDVHRPSLLQLFIGQSRESGAPNSVICTELVSQPCPTHSANRSGSQQFPRTSTLFLFLFVRLLLLFWLVVAPVLTEQASRIIGGWIGTAVSAILRCVRRWRSVRGLRVRCRHVPLRPTCS